MRQNGKQYIVKVILLNDTSRFLKDKIIFKERRGFFEIFTSEVNFINLNETEKQKLENIIINRYITGSVSLIKNLKFLSV